MVRGPGLLLILGVSLFGCAELFDIESPVKDKDDAEPAGSTTGTGPGSGSSGSGTSTKTCGGELADDHCFEVSSDKAEFSAAKLQCSAKGGRLAKAETEAARTAIGKQLGLSEEVYIGATEVEVFGATEYHWLDGSTVKSAWMPTQPDYGNDEDCVTFQNAGAMGALDSLCSRSLLYVCEY